MTGSWLIVKWVGLAVLALYLVLLLIVLWRVRGKLAELRGGLFLWPILVGNFVGISVPWLYENVAFKRGCFVVASAIYACGIGILVRGLLQPGQKGLFKKGSVEDCFQSLNLN